MADWVLVRIQEFAGNSRNKSQCLAKLRKVITAFVWCESIAPTDGRSALAGFSWARISTARIPDNKIVRSPDLVNLE